MSDGRVGDGPTAPRDEGYFKLPADIDNVVEMQHPSAELDGDFDDVPMRDLTTETDIWTLRDDAAAKLPKFKTWDGFEQSSLQPAAFLTEAGTSAFDAFLASEDDPCQIKSHDSYDTLHPSRYSACLLALSLGRESVLFSWSSEKRTFLPVLGLTKVPGYSGDSLSGILRLCTSCGEANRRLASFVDRTYTTNATPSRVALANSLDRLLLAVQEELGARGLGTRSILQLQSLVRPVFALLSYFQRLVSQIKISTSDSELLSLVYKETQSTELSEPFLKDTMGEILRMVSKPFCEFVEQWIGVEEEVGVPIRKDGPGKGFVRVGNAIWVDDQGFELAEPDYFLDMDNMPTFVPDEMAQAIFETGRNLRFLQSYHSHHPLASSDTFVDAPKLEWQYDWESITRVEQKALAFQHAVSKTLRRFRAAGGKSLEACSNKPTAIEDNILQLFGKDKEHLEGSILASMARLDQTIQKAQSCDMLSKTLRDQLFKAHEQADAVGFEFSPHWSLLPLLSFGPLVYAQARLVNRECLRLLYTEHGLREHLRLQRAFQLLGNGMFSSRLSNALFNPDMDTTERQAGVARSGENMGLRLASRENWPPASSELRLALMGTLTESYQQDTQGACRRNELPGDLSFAIRDLSPEEMEACMDPDSLEALDFLRISYKPSAPLLPVMTPAILLKYDRIFKVLLRLLRMLFVVDQLFRDISWGASRWKEPDVASLRFRIEAHHFVSNVARYFFDTGINKPWCGFETWLDKVEKDVEDVDATVQPSILSPDRLGEQHERTLDEIMTSMLLRKRQQPVLKLLEEIFTLILRFAKKARLRAEGAQVDPQEMKELYKAFRAKIEIFITVVRGMTEKAGYGQKREAKADENPIVMLLLLLDMSNYYVKR